MDEKGVYLIDLLREEHPVMPIGVGTLSPIIELTVDKNAEERYIVIIVV
jgi:hypothetical protein